MSYETIRLWCNKFCRMYANRLKRQHQGYGNTYFIDEVFIKIRCVQHYLWRVVDVFLQKKRDSAAAKWFSSEFFGKLISNREISPLINCTATVSRIRNCCRTRSTTQTRIRASGQSFRISQREFENELCENLSRQNQAQRFPDAHATVYILFNVVRCMNYPQFLKRKCARLAFATIVVCVVTSFAHAQETIGDGSTVVYPSKLF